MFTHMMERTDDLEDPRPAPITPMAPAASALLESLAVMSHHPRTPGEFWDTIGWTAEGARNNEASKQHPAHGPSWKPPLHGYGPTFRETRIKARLSRGDVAKALDLAECTVKEWEIGRKPIPAKHLARFDAAKELAARAHQDIIGRGERLATIRANAGLNPRQLSRIVGVLPSDVTEWERNLRPIPYSVVPAIEAACKDTLIPTWKAA